MPAERAGTKNRHRIAQRSAEGILENGGGKQSAHAGSARRVSTKRGCEGEPVTFGLMRAHLSASDARSTETFDRNLRPRRSSGPMRCSCALPNATGSIPTAGSRLQVRPLDSFEIRSRCRQIGKPFRRKVLSTYCMPAVLPAAVYGEANHWLHGSMPLHVRWSFP